ncbi:MAG TPA: L,D-transpeptidase family protein [Thermomicrobiales bacterium]|nr:L,D-transpeptidase family protein [Thermomicrobiales bacterium]
MRWTRVLLGVLCGLALALASGGRAGEAAPPGHEMPSWVDVPTQVYFPQTGHNLADPLLYYWRENGGAAVFGLPISEPFPAGPNLVAQYFEKTILEYRPNSGGEAGLAVGYGAATTSDLNLRAGPGTTFGAVRVLDNAERVRLVAGPVKDAQGRTWYEVAGDFGTGWSVGDYLQRDDDPIQITTQPLDPKSPQLEAWPFKPLAPIVLGAIGPDRDDLTVFPTTGHTLGQPFKKYWEEHGGVFVFGLPISEPFQEVNPDNGQKYLTQYFEHARLEYHPENPGADDKVLPAALGRWAAAAAGVSTAAAARKGDAPDYSPDLFTGVKWIEVNLSEQRLTAFDGDEVLLTTLVRSGKQGWETPPGTYRIFSKVPITDMTLGVQGVDPWYYYTPDVPWVMYFLAGGFAIHGAVYDAEWGTPTSHGCINVPVDLAKTLYDWAPVGTLVWIHY